jgi:SpoVK/Ycf46/Vps4 family AAA+-type ATPase
VALNLWDAEEESVFQLLNSMHVQASSTVDLPWAWRRSPTNVDDESSSGAAATSTATTMAAAVETASLVGFEPVYKSLLLLLSGHFAVRSVVHRCHYRCPLPPTVIALDGAAGTGKSTVVHSLCAAGGLLTRNGRLALHVERLDGKRLCSGADMPLEQALQRLTEAYARAATYAPSLVVVEDAHVLCQPFADDAATRDERRLLLMLHLQRLLGETKAQNRRQHEKAQALAAEYHQNAAVSSSSSSTTAADECFWREEVAAVALAGRVVTLLVTESLTETCDSSLWPHANGASVAAAAAAVVVDRVVPMPYLHGDQRWKIWQRLSRRVTATATETETETETATVREHRQHRKWFIRQSEGYVVRDLVKVAELFTAQQLQQRHATSPMSKTELWSRFTAATTAASTAASTATTAGRSAASSSSSAAASRRWDDLVAVMQTYVPLATSSASSSSSAAAASQQSPSQQVQPLDTLQRRHRLMDRIGGYHDVKHVLQRTLRFPLTYHRLYARSPIKLPRALMLFGPPGIGKTFLAQALGQQFGQGFFSVRGPQLLDKYIGASEKAVRALFQRAQALKKPALLFFDEFEALAPRRGKDNTGVTDRIVNQLLTFIDGVEGTRHGDAGADNDDGDGDGDGDEEARAGDGTAASHRRRVMASAATVDGERDRYRENEDDEDDEDEEGTYTSPLRMKDYDAYDSDHRSPSPSSSLPPAAHRDGAATRPAAASAAAAPCPIFILVASSRPDLIDPALLRPGRVEKHVYIGYPSSADVVDILRKQLLAVNAAAAPADDYPAMQTVLQRIAQTEAVRLFTPADLKAIVDTAYLLAVHERLAAGDRPSTGGGGVGGGGGGGGGGACPVTIAPPHLWRAFQETRPSTTASDRSFFESVYQRFLDQKQPAADATGPPPPTPPPSQPPLHESLTRKAAEAALPLQVQDIADDQRVSLR